MEVRIVVISTEGTEIRCDLAVFIRQAQGSTENLA